MFKLLIRLSYIFGVITLVLSCDNKKFDNAVATIGDEIIDGSTINRIVEYEIYDNMCRIYDARLEATREYIGIKLLNKSAEEKGISVEQLISDYCSSKARKYDEETMKLRLIDSLSIHYNAQILLKEPIAPVIKFSKLLSYERGNPDSKIIITEISDFDCGLCSYMHEGYESLYKKYAEQIKFVHTIFSEEVKPSARGAYAAGLQDKYWEMADTLFAMPRAADSAQVMSVAVQLGLDMDQFVSDYMSNENIEKLKNNSIYLSGLGIVQTPTILINGHPLRHVDDIKHVHEEIERALNK